MLGGVDESRVKSEGGGGMFRGEGIGPVSCEFGSGLEF